MNHRLRYLFSLGIACGFLFARALPLTAEPKPSAPDLPAKARTILKQHCFGCHGEDPEKIEGDGLAILDHKMLVERKLIVAGQPGKSPLIKKVELGTMPPPGEGAPVPTDEKRILRAWIEAGALPFAGEADRH